MSIYGSSPLEKILPIMRRLNAMTDGHSKPKRSNRFTRCLENGQLRIVPASLDYEAEVRYHWLGDSVTMTERFCPAPEHWSDIATITESMATSKPLRWEVDESGLPVTKERLQTITKITEAWLNKHTHPTSGPISPPAITYDELKAAGEKVQEANKLAKSRGLITRAARRKDGDTFEHLILSRQVEMHNRTKLGLERLKADIEALQVNSVKVKSIRPSSAISQSSNETVGIMPIYGAIPGGDLMKYEPTTRIVMTAPRSPDPRYPHVKACPLCGSDGYRGASVVHCSNVGCSNHG